MIKGNTDGIKEYILNILDDIYNIKIEKGKIIDLEILETIGAVSKKINREINVAIDRNGNIIEISIGDSNTATLPSIITKQNRLSGIRMIHTHPSGNSHLSSVDISALITLKLDMMIAVGLKESGSIKDISYGYCTLIDDVLSYETVNNISTDDLLTTDFLQKIMSIESQLKQNTHTDDNIESAILVGIDTEASLDELKELAKACDIKVVGKFFQKRTKIENTTFIGTGKARELSLFKQVKHADLIIFDDELSGIQIKNLEDITNCRVIDRTVLILEIFARRAQSTEGKIQVQLATLKYNSTKLIGYGTQMSRIGGGLGSKGAGETKLEIDRRRIKDQIFQLKNQLDKIKKTRMLQREKRNEAGVPKISLVGYTNVGKSTLRNLLVKTYPAENNNKKEDVLAKNMLFATLDVTTRTILLPNKKIASVTDTVGFIKKLPHELVEAFKSTLEEVSFADMIIHVADATSPTIDEEISAVENVLKELNADNKPTILAINKIDGLSSEQINTIKEKYMSYNKYDIIDISARSEINIDKLVEKIQNTLPDTTSEVTFIIPYTDTSAQAYLHKTSIITEEKYEDNYIKINAKVDNKTLKMLNKYKK